MALLRADSEPLNGRIVMKGPRPLNADNQIPLAKVIRQLIVLAFVNDETSPLAELADAVIPLSAGEEKAVAATKSFLATLSALLHLCACWSENTSLFNALKANIVELTVPAHKNILLTVIIFSPLSVSHNIFQ